MQLLTAISALGFNTLHFNIYRNDRENLWLRRLVIPLLTNTFIIHLMEPRRLHSRLERSPRKHQGWVFEPQPRYHKLSETVVLKADFLIGLPTRFWISVHFLHCHIYFLIQRHFTIRTTVSLFRHRTKICRALNVFICEKL